MPSAIPCLFIVLLFSIASAFQTSFLKQKSLRNVKQFATLAITLETDPAFSTFSSLLRQFGDIRELLSCSEAYECPIFTIFAPTDKAFAKLGENTVQALKTQENKEVLRRLIKHHIGIDVMRLRHTLPGYTVTAVDTLAEMPVEVILEKNVLIDGVHCAVTNIECENGLIHGLDQVLCGSVGMDFYDPGNVGGQ